MKASETYLNNSAAFLLDHLDDKVNTDNLLFLSLTAGAHVEGANWCNRRFKTKLGEHNCRIKPLNDFSLNNPDEISEEIVVRYETAAQNACKVWGAFFKKLSDNRSAKNPLTLLEKLKGITMNMIHFFYFLWFFIPVQGMDKQHSQNNCRTLNLPKRITAEKEGASKRNYSFWRQIVGGFRNL